MPDPNLLGEVMKFASEHGQQLLDVLKNQPPAWIAGELVGATVAGFTAVCLRKTEQGSNAGQNKAKMDEMRHTG